MSLKTLSNEIENNSYEFKNLMTSPYKDYPLRQSRLDSDPYSTTLTEDLLRGQNEWRSVPEIVRLTLKTFSDVLNWQGTSLREIESQLPSKASKAELSSGLSVKANVSDISRTVSEMRSTFESTSKMDVMMQQMDEKLSRSELHHLISSKVSYGDLQASLDSKADSREVQSELRALRAGIEEIQQETYRRLSSTVSVRDFERLEELVSTKADANEVNEKANKQSVSNALHRKANKADLDLKADKTDIEALGQLLKEKADYAAFKSEVNEINSVIQREIEILSRKSQESAILLQDLEHNINAALSKKTDYSDLEKILQNLSKKPDTEQVLGEIRFECRKTEEMNLQNVDSLSQKLEDEVKKLKDYMEIVQNSQRTEIQEVVKYLQDYAHSGTAHLGKDLSLLTKEVEDLRHKKLDRIELSELRESLDRLKRETIQGIHETKEYFSAKERDLKATTDNKMSYEDTTELATRLIRSEIDTFYRESETVKSELLQSKHELRNIRDLCDITVKDVHSKASLADIYSVLDSKPSHDDLQHCAIQLREEINRRALTSDLMAYINDQALINDYVCGETCVGRWLWRSGQIKSGGSVPWESQSVNTCPENFMWEPDSTSILTISPGLYEILFGVYSRSKPEVQLHINGEAVIIDGLPLSKFWGRHPSGNLSGMTCLDFFTLPARARVTLTYAGDPGAEGFLGIRKL